MRRAIVIGIGMLALAGCQKKDGEAAPSATAAGEPAAAKAPMSMARKPGLWTQTIATGGTSQTIKLCLDAATDKQMQITGQALGQGMCSENTMISVPGGMAFKSTCDTGPGGKTVTNGTATGDFQGNYTVKATSVTTGAQMAQANGTHEVTIQAKWEGPCPAGLNPGDMQLPGGMTINAAQMMGKAAGGAK